MGLVWRADCTIIHGTREVGMHIHGNQLGANLQVMALAAAVKAEEKRQAERTREGLWKAASALSGEADADCVVRLSGDDASQEQASQQDRDERKPDEQAAAEDGGEVFSDWA
jgi:hypothetical protein